MDGQLSIFDYLETLQMPPNKKHILSVGDKVGRIVLGECRIATVKKVEGLPKYPFYRTDQGCYSYEEGLEDVNGLEGNTAQALSKSGIYSEIKRIAAASGLDRRVYPHLFRKTTATNIIRRGGTDSDAGEYLGHKPQGVTARHYAFRSEDHTVKIFESYVAAI